MVKLESVYSIESNADTDIEIIAEFYPIIPTCHFKIDTESGDRKPVEAEIPSTSRKNTEGNQKNLETMKILDVLLRKIEVDEKKFESVGKRVDNVEIAVVAVSESTDVNTASIEQMQARISQLEEIIAARADQGQQLNNIVPGDGIQDEMQQVRPPCEYLAPDRTNCPTCKKSLRTSYLPQHLKKKKCFKKPGRQVIRPY